MSAMMSFPCLKDADLVREQACYLPSLPDGEPLLDGWLITKMLTSRPGIHVQRWGF